MNHQLHRMTSGIVVTLLVTSLLFEKFESFWQPLLNVSLKMVSRAGLEPATIALKVRCSTN